MQTCPESFHVLPVAKGYDERLVWINISPGSFEEPVGLDRRYGRNWMGC